MTQIRILPEKNMPDAKTDLKVLERDKKPLDELILLSIVPTEGGIEDDMVDNENLPDGGVELNQNKGSSSGKSEILYLVEQLLTLEHYSREECDRLIEIMNSRVADYGMKEGGDVAPKSPYTRRRAIMEARKVITENMVGSSLKSDVDNSDHGSKSLLTPIPQREHLSGGSWNIQDEIQRLRSKAVEVKKPDEPKSLEAPKSDNEIVDLASEDARTTQDDVPTEALSSLPTIEEQNQMTEEKEKDVEDEFTEVPDVIASQGSSNTSDPKKPDSPTPKRPVTRNRSAKMSFEEANLGVGGRMKACVHKKEQALVVEKPREQALVMEKSQEQAPETEKDR
ncbi:hypothetical protein Tco_0974835 [Tanacetum coccineum]|uniref:Uncharacterized protein n=1 Tax=Tanacetum coccineum TaxID=301880 RepID=A0ABQ5ECR6_9ASTR